MKKAATLDMWNLNNVIIEMKLNSEEDRTRDINFSLNCLLADVAVCVSCDETCSVNFYSY